MRTFFLIFSTIAIIVLAGSLVNQFSWSPTKNIQFNNHILSIYEDLNINDDWSKTYELIRTWTSSDQLKTNCDLLTDGVCGVMPPKQNIAHSNFVLTINVSNKKIVSLIVSNPDGKVIDQKGVE